MNAIQAIQTTITSGEMVCMGYLNDLTDTEMMQRPAPGCNHINWQVGHLIASEHQMMEHILPGSMPPLPTGFVAQYSKEAATSDDPATFLSKEQLLQVFQAQRAATLANLNQQTPEDLDRASGVDYAPNVAMIFSMQGLHWLMHAGQWAVVRRQLGRPPLF